MFCRTFLREEVPASMMRQTGKCLHVTVNKLRPDGEILFLAANPEMKAKGTGSFLLNEFARREKGKNIYLYTDNACTYQFYERRGFQRAGEKDVILKIGHKKIDLQCFLYSKAAE